MKRPVDPKPSQADAREKLIGLGKRSISKSYYPELKSRLDELEHFRALLDRVSDSILIVNVDTGRILDVSGATVTMLGCGIETLEGMDFKQLLPNHIARYCSHLFNTEDGLVKLEGELRSPTDTDRPPVPVEMSIRIVARRNTREAVIMARDISERKRNEEALRKSHDNLEIRVRERTSELDRANKAKSEFLSIVSHELRTPLTSVIGFAKIIRKKLVDIIYPAVNHAGDKKLCKEMSRVKKNIDIIVSEGDRLTALINDVLDLAKLEADKVDYAMEIIPPNEFLDQSMAAVSGLFGASNLELIAEVEPNLPPVKGDSNRLIQVMVNLFSNGIKFTKEGTVTCQARQDEDHIRICVADTGIGIPETMKSTIFDKFTQGEDVLADRPRGTGLGLPICRHIINAHKGHLWLESREDMGSSFIFTLPVYSDPKP